jgi:hypothetical protein
MTPRRTLMLAAAGFLATQVARRERLRPILAGPPLTDATRIDDDATGIRAAGEAIAFSG